MKRISELIAELEKMKRQHGDIPVKYQTLHHEFDPEPIVLLKPEPRVIVNA